MVFSSFEFLFRFLPVFLVIYYLTPKKWKNLVLFAASIVFYTVGEAEYVLLLLASVLVNYFFGRAMYQTPEEGRGKKQLLLLLAALGYDFGMLFFYKYSGRMDKLPLGISFYTFQSAAYIIDVYRGVIPAEKSLINFGTYLTMFPQLIAGPIINYSEVRLKMNGRTVTVQQFEDGLKLLVIGLASKVIIADRIGMLWNNIQGIGFESISTVLAWMGAFAYSIQLYFDFLGYSLMAMGLGAMLGFEIPRNFFHPYISKSVSEFWRRWHITLGRWFRDYVYIPLGGNRKGKARTMCNLLVVWALTALWHGASGNYLIWGASLLVLLMLEKLFFLPYLEKSKVVGHLYLLFVVPLTWVAFAIPDVKQIGVYFTRLFPFFGTAGAINQQDYLRYLKDFLPLLLLGILFATPYPAAFYKAVQRKWLGNVLIAGLLGLSIYYLAISTNNPFLYFNF
ncbi:MAG: MBOAT family protein [Roseburia sp.]|nr:MBOAT family protein [Roseburia sp.]